MRWVVMLLVLGPAISRAEPTTVAKIESLLQRLYGERDIRARYRIADEAQALCEKAMAERPKDPQPRLLMARALTVADVFHPEACRPGLCERAVDELRKARALDVSGVEAERIASELGIVLSRLGRFAEALDEYDRALRLVEAERRPNSLDEDDKAVLYGNSAETLMALGRLDDAIARYRLAEAAANPGSTEWQLAQWGLGVALDRDEQVEKSRSAVARVLEYDPTMARLSDDGVFFEPAGDKRYYEALGHEVAGDREHAALAWREYLTVQPNARWTRRAKAHLDALKKGAPISAKLPEEHVEVGIPQGMGLRTPQQLHVAVRERLDDLRLCYTRALRTTRRPTVGGQLTIAVEITPQGWVMPRVRAIDTLVDDGGLVRCVEQAASSWRFSRVDSEKLESALIPILFGKVK